ncbi:hypothetical protein [Hymenobacter cellulosilyticus]|uniref:Uncharacterized protein n=1 Tax=Hymenobacter cellulosilyticus TaxID=2932248 RepID=A0A8T9Q6G4_9BACT|nr:hypothetical protein [Hymenobacter cellulosilyticus]UOQ71991.1 hypothetical protein MUN79_25950 [Hymenobacter cellulosilyticus]
MKNWLIIGALVLLSGACQKATDTRVPDPAYYRQQEAQVLEDLFDELIAAHRMSLPPRPGAHASDTSEVPLYVADSLFGKKSQWPYYRRIGTGRVASATQKRLVATLADSVTESAPLPPQLTSLLKRNHFRVMVARRSAHFPALSIGITLSRVIFNSDFTEACFVHAVGGGDSGEGALLFVRKEKSRWVISQRLRLWIA